MMMPSIFGEDLFSDWMDFSFPDVERKLYGHRAGQLMNTDVKENGDNYEVDVELPGFKKDEVNAQLKDGYLIISAAKKVDQDQKDEDGKYLRRERFAGNVSRSFYVGDHITEQDVHAKFEDGILKLTIPKKDKKQVEDKRYVTIEG